jgi:hypothetical protein
VTPERVQSDTLHFEVLDLSDAAHLCERLARRWIVHLAYERPLWIAKAVLRPRGGDLAVLLREVEAWTSERGLGELWFHLDGRVYLIRAKTPAAA